MTITANVFLTARTRVTVNQASGSPYLRIVPDTNRSGELVLFLGASGPDRAAAATAQLLALTNALAEALALIPAPPAVLAAGPDDPDDEPSDEPASPAALTACPVVWFAAGGEWSCDTGPRHDGPHHWARWMAIDDGAAGTLTDPATGDLDAPWRVG